MNVRTFIAISEAPTADEAFTQAKQDAQNYEDDSGEVGSIVGKTSLYIAGAQNAITSKKSRPNLVEQCFSKQRRNFYLDLMFEIK